MCLRIKLAALSPQKSIVIVIVVHFLMRSAGGKIGYGIVSVDEMRRVRVVEQVFIGEFFILDTPLPANQMRKVDELTSRNSCRFDPFFLEYALPFKPQKTFYFLPDDLSFGREALESEDHPKVS